MIKNMSEKRDFKGVWIPRGVWLDTRLNALEKVILTEIDSLDNGEKGCYASNEHLAEFCQCSKTKVSTAIKKLIDCGYIYVQNFDGRKRELKSRLSNFERQTIKNCKADYQNLKESNIDNNTDSVINTNVLITGDNVASDTVNESNPQKVTQKAEPDSKPSYGNSTINSMFDYWQAQVGTPIISREKGNRRACYNLLRNKHIGEEKLRHAIEFVGEIKENRFAPRISDFVDLQSKFNELCAFKTKYQAQQDVSDDKTPNKAVSSAMKGYNSAGGNVEFVPWRPTAGDLEREREWQEKERRQTEESAKVDPEWLEKLKEETIRKIYDHGDRK